MTLGPRRNFNKPLAKRPPVNGFHVRLQNCVFFSYFVDGLNALRHAPGK